MFLGSRNKVQLKETLSPIRISDRIFLIAQLTYYFDNFNIEIQYKIIQLEFLVSQLNYVNSLTNIIRNDGDFFCNSCITVIKVISGRQCKIKCFGKNFCLNLNISTPHALMRLKISTIIFKSQSIEIGYNIILDFSTFCNLKLNAENFSLNTA